MEIADGVFFFSGKPGLQLRPGAASVNVVVVRGRALAMIDSGLVRGGGFRSLRDRMKGCGLDLGEVAWIAHTHSHWDHINASGAVQQASSARLAETTWVTTGGACGSLLIEKPRNWPRASCCS